jgi:hypothetical protein
MKLWVRNEVQVYEKVNYNLNKKYYTLICFLTYFVDYLNLLMSSIAE